MRQAAGLRPPFLPVLGRVFAYGGARPPSQLPAALSAGGVETVLVSVVTIAEELIAVGERIRLGT
jgi:hypothetical protein